MYTKFLAVLIAFTFLGNGNTQLLDDISECGKSINCYKLNTCSSLSECDGIGIYYFNSTDQLFYVSMATKNSYVAFAQNLVTATDRMDANMKGAFCSKNGNNAVLGFLTGTGKGNNPTWHLLSSIKDATVLSTEVKDGIAKCSFTRPTIITDTESLKALHSWDATNLINIIASGTGLNGINPTIHDKGKKYTDAAIANFKDKSVPDVSQETTTPGTTESSETNHTSGVTTTPSGTTGPSTTPSSTVRITGSFLPMVCLLVIFIQASL